MQKLLEFYLSKIIALNLDFMMSLDARKIELVKAILNLKYESSVDLVESVLLKMQEEPDWWDELPDSIKESYATGLKEMEKGKEIDVEVFLKKI